MNLLLDSHLDYPSIDNVFDIIYLKLGYFLTGIFAEKRVTTMAGGKLIDGGQVDQYVIHQILDRTANSLDRTAIN